MCSSLVQWMLTIETRDRMNSNNLLKIFVSQNNDFVKHCSEEDQNFSCDQKKVTESESRLISRKMKEPIRPLKILYQSNKTWYILRIGIKHFLLNHVYKFYSFHLGQHLFYVTYIPFNLRCPIFAKSVLNHVYIS